jgi:chromosome segregation ATPase
MKRYTSSESPDVYHVPETGDRESPVNRSFATVTSLNSSTHTTASSSKAVLAALRALQDKIRRLEAERSQALDEAADLRGKLKSYEIEAEHSRQRDAMQAQRQIQDTKLNYEKLVDEKKDLENRAHQLEERNRDAEAQLNELLSQSNRLTESKNISDSKIKELSLKVQSLENQLQASQQREKGYPITR